MRRLPRRRYLRNIPLSLLQIRGTSPTPIFNHTSYIPIDVECGSRSDSAKWNIVYPDVCVVAAVLRPDVPVVPGVCSEDRGCRGDDVAAGADAGHWFGC